MKRVFDRYEPDEWTVEGSKILAPEKLAKLKAEFLRGPVIIQHWLYRGMSSPRVSAVEDLEEFEIYLKENAVPGDAFDLWSFLDCCKQESVLVEGKLHDQDGCVPKGGAY